MNRTDEKAGNPTVPVVLESSNLMRALFTLVLLGVFLSSNGQFEGKWYTFRLEDISYNILTKDKLITGRIVKYNTPREFFERVDSFTIEKRFIKNDSTLYIVTNREPDNLKFDLKELQIHKFVYHKSTNTVTSFFFDTMIEFSDFQSNTDNIQKKDIREFIDKDDSRIGYVTYYSKDSIDKYIAYPKLIDQSPEKITSLYSKLTSVYKAFSSKTDEEKLPYALLKGMSKSVIRVPVYLELRICPLLNPEDSDETEIREKFKSNLDLMEALDKFRRSH